MKRCWYILAATLVASSLSAPAYARPDYRVVVHTTNPTTTVSKTELSQIFLKREMHWSNGSTVYAVDQIPSSPVREEFSTDVLKRNTQAIKQHWLRQVFAGREVPPPEFRSDSEVLDYVKSNPGAIGYVSSEAALDPGIKILSVTD